MVMDIEAMRGRFNAKFDRRTADECWEWTAARNQHGYGLFHARPLEQLAHRMAYRFAYGDIPSGFQICHRCDNPPCVNPGHLFLGTHRDNMIDRESKGRGTLVPFTRATSPHTRFSDADVADMVTRYLAGEHQVDIAALYNTRQPVVSKIVRARCDVDPDTRRCSRPNGKLTDEQAAEVLRLYQAGGITQKTLGARFGITQAAVSHIICKARG